MDKVAVGIDIGGTNIKAGLVDKYGNVTNTKKISTNAEKGFSKSFESVKALINEYITEIGKENICGIGCASAGQINHVTGKVLFASGNIPGLSGFELKKELEDTFNLRTLVENDVNAVALGEKWVGCAKDFDDFICLALGTGIGGAIYRNGEIDHGYDGIAAEFGHISIKYDGLLCNCGNRGCFERYASVGALIRNFKSELEKGKKSIVLDLAEGELNKITGELIFKGVELGDELSKQAIDNYMEYLSLGIVNLLHIFNPHQVVIGGGISDLGDKLLDPLKKLVYKKAMPKFTENLVMVTAALVDNAALCGVTKQLFVK